MTFPCTAVRLRFPQQPSESGRRSELRSAHRAAVVKHQRISADYTRSQLPDSTVRQRRPQRGARPGFSTWDFAALKNISVAEGKELQFRAELFNFLNHTNLRLPNSDISSPTFGEIHSSDPGSAKIELLGERLRWKVSSGQGPEHGCWPKYSPWSSSSGYLPAVHCSA